MSFRLELPQFFAADDKSREILAYLTRTVNMINYAFGFLDVPEQTAGAEIRAEDPNNKSISISERSTNTQYPSAKAVYEYATPQTRKVNGHALDADVDLTAEDVDAVPTERKINGHALSEDVALTPDNLGEADFIVETGTDGIWTYRKWESGVAECWGTADVFVAAGAFQAYANVYIKSFSTSYPQGLFVEKPVVSKALSTNDLSSGIYAWLGQSFSDDATAARFIITRPANTTSDRNFGVAVYAIGRWKE